MEQREHRFQVWVYRDGEWVKDGDYIHYLEATSRGETLYRQMPRRVRIYDNHNYKKYEYAPDINGVMGWRYA